MFGLLRALLFTLALKQSADGARRGMRRAVARAVAALCGALVLMVGAGFLLTAGRAALVLATDRQSANLICGGALVLIGLLAIAASKAGRKRLPEAAQEAPGMPIQPLGAGLLGRDLEVLLSRNAGTIATGAFIAGLILATRRR